MIDREALANWDAAAGGWQPRPPLCPGPADIAFYIRAAGQAAEQFPDTQSVQLGVTAAIATMAWPDSISRVAIDFSSRMIQHAWPHGNQAARASLVRCDWLAMPFDDHSKHLFVGDGCYSTLGSLERARALNDEVARVLVPGGLLAIRCFSRTTEPPSIDELFNKVTDGQLTDFGLFRWLLIMALQGHGTDGVRLSDVWREWHARMPDPERCPVRRHWRDSDLKSMQRWASINVRYVYPTVEELEEIAGEQLELISTETPAGAYGRHFPRLLFRRA